MDEPGRVATYWCYFKCKETEHVALSKKGIGVFKDGFWVTKEFSLTQGSDCRYWIPPSAIKYIEKY